MPPVSIVDSEDSRICLKSLVFSGTNFNLTGETFTAFFNSDGDFLSGEWYQPPHDIFYEPGDFAWREGARVNRIREEDAMRLLVEMYQLAKENK